MKEVVLLVKIHSLNKGKRGEREVAKLLTRLTCVDWKRVPSSGALFTTHQSVEFRGDVYCVTKPYDDVVVEVKNHKGMVSFNDLLNPDSILWNWVSQLKAESQDSLGVLFFKSNGKWCWWFKPPGSVGYGLCPLFHQLRGISHYLYNWGLITKGVKNGK